MRALVGVIMLVLVFQCEIREASATLRFSQIAPIDNLLWVSGKNIKKPKTSYQYNLSNPCLSGLDSLTRNILRYEFVNDPWFPFRNGSVDDGFVWNTTKRVGVDSIGNNINSPSLLQVSSLSLTRVFPIGGNRQTSRNWFDVNCDKIDVSGDLRLRNNCLLPFCVSLPFGLKISESCKNSSPKSKKYNEYIQPVSNFPIKLFSGSMFIFGGMVIVFIFMTGCATWGVFWGSVGLIGGLLILGIGQILLFT